MNTTKQVNAVTGASFAWNVAFDEVKAGLFAVCLFARLAEQIR